MSQSEASFHRLTSEEAVEDDTPTFGWLSSDLPGYDPSTLDLKTLVHPQGSRWRPLVELEPTDHPLSIEQREGITVARVRALTAPFQTD